MTKQIKIHSGLLLMEMIFMHTSLIIFYHSFESSSVGCRQSDESDRSYYAKIFISFISFNISFPIIMSVAVVVLCFEVGDMEKLWLNVTKLTASEQRKKSLDNSTWNHHLSVKVVPISSVNSLS